MKFLELVGNASTSVWLDGKFVGNDVNAATYLDGTEIVIKLESNSHPVRGIRPVRMTQDEYEEFKEKGEKKLFIRGIELFGGETFFD